MIVTITHTLGSIELRANNEYEIRRRDHLSSEIILNVSSENLTNQFAELMNDSVDLSFFVLQSLVGQRLYIHNARMLSVFFDTSDDVLNYEITYIFNPNHSSLLTTNGSNQATRTYGLKPTSAKIDPKLDWKKVGF